MSFDGKVILITGSSSGIGADVARHIAKLGGKVALVGRNESKLKVVAQEIECTGATMPLIIIADVKKDAQRIVDETVRHFGKLDVLINNASSGPIRFIMDTDLDTFDNIMDTNVRSVVAITKSAVPHLEKTKGNIVNISSFAGLIPYAPAAIFSISKSALDMFTQCAAVEFGPKRIRINSINTAAIIAPPLFPSNLSMETVMKKKEARRERVPLGRAGELSDTSNAIAYLASDDAAFINGMLLKVDGGSTSAVASKK